ncbi:MAG: PEP-CTERM sorting domain-containing protein [Planctomycetota bacterium]|nr:PEP-CTERM sorting domain-containing protein [Planctomycetota bacterium]
MSLHAGFRLLMGCVAALLVGSPTSAGPINPPDAFGRASLWVLDNSGSAESVLYIDLYTNMVTQIISNADILATTGFTSVNFLEAGAAHGGGAFFFVDRASDTLLRFDSGGNLSVHLSKSVLEAASSGSNISPKGLAFSQSTGYLVDDQTDSILSFNAATSGSAAVFVSKATLLAASSNSNIDLNGGIATDSSGNLYVASDQSASQELFKITPTGTVTLLKAGSPFVDIDNFLTVDPDGNVVVADDGDNPTASAETAIYKVTQSGVVTTIADKAALDGVVGTTANLEAGLVYGAIPGIKNQLQSYLFIGDEGSDSILGIRTDRTPVEFEVFVTAADITAVTGSIPEIEGGIAFIPEPASFVLMGASILGFCGWRRGRKRQGRHERRTI